MTKSPVFHFFLIISCLLGILIFMYGFFPVKYVSRNISSLNDLPDHVLNIRVDPKDLYFPRVRPLVFIVIDALRWDFFIKPENIGNVPYITKLLNSGQACLFHAEGSPPTVTMPRLKALMTGSVPNFIDVMLNLGSSQIKGDSLLMQATQSQRKVVFYGDDTWLKMFPSAFLRSEGTTSFFVTDYEEVDFNVTRHIPKELASSDWDLMILHYLGLDHIGHLAGPFSPLVGPKLREMDRVVEMVVKGLNNTRKDGLSPMLVLVGDHGMRNSGGHGGSTTDEILTSLLFVQPGCSESKWFKQRVWQIDVTATLATFLGFPIPHNSVGTLIDAALTPLQPLHHLYALHYNAQHLKTIAVIANCLDTGSSTILEEAEKTFARLLKSNSSDDKLYDQAVQLYQTASNQLSDCLAHSDAGFHVAEMITACSIILAVIITLIINLLLGIEILCTPKSIFFVLIVSAIISTSYFDSLVSVLAVISSITFTFTLSRLWLYPQTPVISLIKKIRACSPSTIFLLVGTILHAISLFGSSMVEEEHQTWYFFWTSLNLIKLYSISAQIYSKTTKETSLTKQASLVIVLLIAHRLLRTLNQTGDKWADLPDTGDWLRLPENWFYHLLFFIAGLISVWLSLRSLNQQNDVFCNSLHASSLLFVLLCRAATGDITLPFPYPKSKGVAEGTCFWFLVLLASLRQVWKTGQFLETFASFLILTVSLVLRPHNLVILPFLTYASRILFFVYSSWLECSLAHAWLGLAAYFYQGNSNSLTTVDVAAGYVGVADHNMLRVGLLVFLHTSAAPILSFLLLFIGIMRDSHLRRNIHISLQVFTLQKALPLFIACLICVIHRHHLFVWSVFAPKLLYEVMSAMAILFLVMLFWSILLFVPQTRGRR